MSGNQPFSSSRARKDLVDSLPALGICVCSVLGALAGLVVDGTTGAIFGGGIGIAAGLVIGAVARALIRARAD